MTLRQEAYSLIDKLPYESLRAIVVVLQQMQEPQPTAVTESGRSPEDKKLAAFYEMEEMRRQSSQYISPAFDADEERRAAMESKYGRID